MTTQAKKVKPDNLMGATEVAEYLEVSRQRVLELRQKKEGFPKPLTDLKSGPVWDKAAIDEFLEHWDRKPGRPRKEIVTAALGLQDSKEEEQFDPATLPGENPAEVAEPVAEPETPAEPVSEPSVDEESPQPVQAPEQPPVAQPQAPVDNPQVPQQPSADQIDQLEEVPAEPLLSDNR